MHRKTHNFFASLTPVLAISFLISLSIDGRASDRKPRGGISGNGGVSSSIGNLGGGGSSRGGNPYGRAAAEQSHGRSETRNPVASFVRKVVSGVTGGGWNSGGGGNGRGRGGGEGYYHNHNDGEGAEVDSGAAAAEAADPFHGAEGSANPEEDRIAVKPPESQPGDNRIPVGDTEEDKEELEPEAVPMDASTFQNGAVLADYGATGAPTIGQGRSYGSVSSSIDAKLAGAKLGGSRLDKDWGILDVSVKGFNGAAQREAAGKVLGAGGLGVKVARIRPNRDLNDPERRDFISTHGQRYLQAAESFHRLGDYQSALRQADAAIRADGKSPLGYIMKAKALMGLGRYGDAEKFAKYAERQAKTGNTKSEALTVQAMAQQKQGRLADALASADLAKRYASGDSFLIGALATKAFLCEQGQDRECLLENLKKASEIDKAFERHYLMARAGKQVFDPNATDANALMNALGDIPEENPAERSRWFLLLPALLMLGGVGAMIRSARSVLTDAAMKKELAKPLPAAGARDNALLDGKYELVKVIGQSAFGPVWEAKDRSLGRTVAVKELALGTVADGAEGRAAFLEEARVLGSLNHPNLVEIYAALDHPEALFLVCENLEGKTLREIINEHGKLPLANAKRILVDAAKALQQAHSHGILHRDLSAEKIMLTKQGYVKVTDFGTKKSGGALGYRAPESRPGLLTAQTDVYALGVCLHEIVIGGKPDSDGSFGSASAGLGALLRDALAENPEDRIKSAAEFGERLSALTEAAVPVNG